MKKILHFFILAAVLLQSVFLGGFAYADTGDVTVTVTDAIPGAGCVQNGSGTDPSNRTYTCTIKPGFGSVLDLLKGFIKYATFLVLISSVLAISGLGLWLTFAGIEDSAKAKAKEHIFTIIKGIVVLLLVGFILNAIAPWIYQ